MSRRVLLGLTAVGIAITVYMIISINTVGSPQCFGGGNGCKTVENSIYSHLFGISVVWFGIAGYVGMFLIVLANRWWSPNLMLFAALIGIGIEGYLAYLQFFVINAFCQWCTASMVLMVFVTAFTIRWWLTQDDEPLDVADDHVDEDASVV